MSSFAQVVRLGPFQLDLRAAELRLNGNKTQLPEQPFQVLMALLEKPGEVVTREELRQRLWGDDTFVDFEHGLNMAIMRLREALGDSAENPRFIETLPRRGYRLIVSVEEPAPLVAVPASARRWRLRILVLALVAVAVVAGFVLEQRRFERLRAVQVGSLAVLPLENLSGTPDEEYFADGMTEALITELGKIHALRVISRHSVMQYKGTTKTVPQIARELNVDAVVEGSAQRAGDRVRITTQLILADPERHIWSESYEREMRDVLGLQSEVARAIAHQIRVAVTPAEQRDLASVGKVNPEAHEMVLKGRYYWWKRTQKDLARAAEYFQRAIATDPNYAPAYAGLADVYSILVNNGFQDPAESHAQSRAAALKAVALDDSLAEAHVALGNVYRDYDWDWAGAESEYRRALALNPGLAAAYVPYASVLSDQGRSDEAIAANRRGQELDPLAVRITAHLALVYFEARRFDEAIAASKKALELAPGDLMSQVWLGRSYLQKGMVAEAVAELEKAYQGGVPAGSDTELVQAYVAAGRKEDARRVLDAWRAEAKRRYVRPYALAMAHLGVVGDDQTYAWLEKAYQQHDSMLPIINVDPMWDRFRSDPRFQNLLRRMNFPQLPLQSSLRPTAISANRPRPSQWQF